MRTKEAAQKAIKLLATFAYMVFMRVIGGAIVLIGFLMYQLGKLLAGGKKNGK